MQSRRRLINPIWVSRRVWRRVSGAEARYWKQTLATERELFQQQAEARDLRIQKLFDALESRENRVHAFVAEALSLLAALPSASNIVVSPPEVASSTLGDAFSAFGSDKESRHSYGAVYEHLLEHSAGHKKILEIGLGSLNAFAYAGLPPGGSLKAWRTRYPSGVVVGMDIDPESVASVEQPAFVVDQTSDVSLASASRQLAEFGCFDLIVDDGFHDPHANVRTMLAMFKHLKPGGHYVVEDIHESLIDFWRVVGALLPGKSYVLDLRAQRPECDDNVLFISQAPRSED